MWSVLDYYNLRVDIKWKSTLFSFLTFVNDKCEL